MRAALSLLALISLISLALPAPGLAQETVPLALKFVPGDVIQYDITFSGSGSVRSSEGEVAPATLQGSMSLVQKVTQVLPDGSGRLETLMPQADLSVRLADQSARFVYSDGRIRWFANGRQAAPPDADLSQVPLLGSPLVYTLAPNGGVTDIAFPGGDPTADLARMLPNLNFAGASMSLGGLLPDAPVRVGETWRTTAQLAPLGPGFPITVSTSHTLQSFQETGGIGLAKVVGSTEVRLQASSPALALGEGASIAIPEVRQTIASTEFFNTTTGRLIRADYDVQFSTAVSAQVGGEQKGGEIQARFRINMQSR